MGKADIRGDRSAIMAEKNCVVQPFGSDYNLTLVKDDGQSDDKGCFRRFVRLPFAQLLSNIGSEIAFQLPLQSLSSFATMFAEMDRQWISCHMTSLLRPGGSVHQGG
ncbi:hypothetical protein V7S43_003259 [Phytophthora oleae]|uniref:Uncharacterized protein n=1 Tax=Phytophthora oleae TaxID=2107226 RepID=A0ABD3G2A9_9STRA